MAGLAFSLLIVLIAQLSGGGTGSEKNPFWDALRQDWAYGFAEILYVQFMPGGSAFAGESSADWLVRTQAGWLMPLYGMNRSREPETSVWSGEMENYQPPEESALQDNPSIEEREEQSVSKEELLSLLEAENKAAKEPVPFEAHSKRVQVNLEELVDYETLVEQFYTIDTNTLAGTNQLNVKSLTAEDVSVGKRTDGPQILIYHTHSQETFADSVPGDESTSIIGVGERLAEILQEEYGYQVLHHRGKYDVDSRDDAYGKALPAVKQLLEENPTIEVVIDLHRDQMPEETKLVMDLDGRPTARFMFFNGLSRTRQFGDIAYLKNENIGMNLAFSFQMQLKCQEYYPGLTRKIYLKGYRYNMHLCPRTLLVELGAQNNTVEEAMNACDPLAHVLDMVLSGEE